MNENRMRLGRMCLLERGGGWVEKGEERRDSTKTLEGGAEKDKKDMSPLHLESGRKWKWRRRESEKKRETSQKKIRWKDKEGGLAILRWGGRTDVLVGERSWRRGEKKKGIEENDRLEIWEDLIPILAIIGKIENDGFCGSMDP